LDLRHCAGDPDIHPNTIGHYDIAQQQIVVCCDKLAGYDGLKELVTHEMVHAYDHCKFRGMWYCKTTACSELRAYNLSGSCAHIKNEQERLECLRSRAFYSVQGQCSENTQGIVDSVFDDVSVLQSLITFIVCL
jgi:inner membrane protease ATP23